SRRRHTRSKRDWSSDVCSSDLTEGVAAAVGTARCFDVPNCEEALVGMGVGASLLGYRPVMVNLRIEFLMLAMNQIVNHAAKWPRSEERRVGKECRSRRAGVH